MVAGSYVPDVGDIVWLNFDPQAGREQAGHRPALVLTPARYNRLTGLMVCCPMTSKIKGYPFEVIEDRDPPSAVLADQVKSIDWRSRGARKKGKASDDTVSKARAHVADLLNL